MIGNFIIAIGIKLDSAECLNSGYEGNISEDLKNLATKCAKAIITEEIKENADFNFKKNLENTDLKDKFELKFFPTSLDILQEALNYYSKNVGIPLSRSKDSTLEVTESNKDILFKTYIKLKETLICGQENAAWYLAQFYYNGWLVKPNIIYGDFILAIGKQLEVDPCVHSSYKGNNISFQELARICASSISNNKYVYRTGINDTMKLNAEKAINIHLNNTDLKNIFNSSESTIIPTISAPLPSTTHQPSNTVRPSYSKRYKRFQK